MAFAGRSRCFVPSTITVAAELGNGSRVLVSRHRAVRRVVCGDPYPGLHRRVLGVCEVGGDIDTTCAMVGGIIVGAVGLDGVPAEWRTCREPLPALLSIPS